MTMSAVIQRVLLALALAGATVAYGETPPLKPDIPARFEAPVESACYIKRNVMIPMRDGVKLHTVIIIPKGAKGAPMILTRTPYNASGRAKRNTSPSLAATLPIGDDILVEGGYIRVFQDVRG